MKKFKAADIRQILEKHGESFVDLSQHIDKFGEYLHKELPEIHDYLKSSVKYSDMWEVVLYERLSPMYLCDYILAQFANSNELFNKDVDELLGWEAHMSGLEE